jgi:4-amino-4-deoxy-L-arabinose transferase-like glycosyltransferase
MFASHRPTLVTAAATLLLALHWWLGVSGWMGKTVTSDETAHLVSGYSYWRFNDYRLQPENGNLPQRWGALPLLVQQPRLEPADNPSAWSLSHVWAIGQLFFFESGNSTDFMLATSRGMMALLSVATAWLVFAWSRRLWGDAAGLFSLTLYAFSPTTLAHGPLVTSDMAAALALLVATGAFWRYLERPTTGRLLASLLLTGLAAVAKFSFLILVPVYGLLVGLNLLVRHRDGLRPAPRDWARLATTGTAHVIAVWATVWLFFGFRYSGFAPDLPPGWKYYVPWSELLPDEGLRRDVLVFLKDWRLFPEAYVHGFAYVLEAAQNRGAFLIGNYSATGWWWFFPYAFLIKTPLAELGAAAAASIALLHRLLGRGDRAALVSRLRPLVPLLALPAVYCTVSITSNLNIGHRHLLPIYSPLFILAGGLLRPAAGRSLRTAGLALAGLAVVESTAVRPHYLAFFNVTAGGPSQGWRHLVDSSLDWGQELPALARWLENHRRPGEKIYLSYFGMGDARYEGIDAEPLAPYFHHYRPRYWRELEPGLYCVGATMLQDPYSSWNGPWTARHEGVYRNLLRAMREELASGDRTALIEEFGEGPSHPLWNLERLRFARISLYLRQRPPETVIGHSLMVYRLNAAELRILVDGTPEELAGLLEQAAASR